MKSTTNSPITRLYDHPKYWAECYGTASYLPMSKAEMDQLGWDSCDVILVTGDAYVDHPSFGMAVIGRTLEAQGFRVGIIAQPDWRDKSAFMALGKPNLYFGVTAGNMDSMINRYTADRKPRSDDAYTPNADNDRRPDRATLVYSQRCKEAYSDVPVILGGIEASLRRIAHFDYWQNQVRRSILVDATADMLLYGNAERALVELTHRIARGENLDKIDHINGTVFIRKGSPSGWQEIDSTRVDQPGKIDRMVNPYLNTTDIDACELEKRNQKWLPDDAANTGEKVIRFQPRLKLDKNRTVIRLPAFERVRNDKVLYAHANRVLHLETNPGNARALVQRHGEVDVWFNPPPIPLSTAEMDHIFALPYTRKPHPSYGDARIPAYEMIRFSVNIMRGCFGGCTFCSITEHEGRIIQSRSEASILQEVEAIQAEVPGFTGVISDLGGPTANMYRLGCKDPEIEAACRKPSCVYPGICSNLNTDHKSLTQLYRKTRELPGIKKVLISSGLRYDLAVEDPEYVEELVTHHVGGYLKIAPEHTEDAPLNKMMKPGIGSYDKFKEMFEKFSEKAGKEQYLIPYFIAAHPGTRDEDMLELSLWLKRNGFKADQVQAFYPSPMASATTMYHTDKNPLRRVTYKSEGVITPKTPAQRRLHKAFLRYHDPANWPLLRETLKAMGKAHLIGSGEKHLIPEYHPDEAKQAHHASRRKNQAKAHAKRIAKNRSKPIRTQHTGLPPNAGAPQKIGKKPKISKNTSRRK